MEERDLGMAARRKSTRLSTTSKREERVRGASKAAAPSTASATDVRKRRESEVDIGCRSVRDALTKATM